MRKQKNTMVRIVNCLKAWMLTGDDWSCHTVSILCDFQDTPE